MSERIFIYCVLIAVCGLISAGVGLAAASWSFLQIVAVVELVYWIGIPRGYPAQQYQA